MSNALSWITDGESLVTLFYLNRLIWFLAILTDAKFGSIEELLNLIHFTLPIGELSIGVWFKIRSLLVVSSASCLLDPKSIDENLTFPFLMWSVGDSFMMLQAVRLLERPMSFLSLLSISLMDLNIFEG